MKRVFAVILIALFAACSGDNGTAPVDDNHNGGGGGGPVTHLDSLRVDVLGNLAGQLDLWEGTGADTIAVRALNYLNHEPLIKHAGITEGTTTVWAVFKDGVPLIIPNNRVGGSPTDTLVDNAAIAPPRSSMAPRRVVIPAGRRMMTALRIPTKGLELPERATFRAINAIGTCFVNPIPVVKMLLRKGHYTNSGDLAGTVDDMMNVHGNGVFYLDTHGGGGKDAANALIYGLWTATTADKATLAKYKAMLDNGELLEMLEKGRDELGNCRYVSHYGITAPFVNDHMSFGKNSVVIIDACHSAGPGAIDMQQAFANSGASVYVGWTARVKDDFAYKSIKYLLDRIVGANEISPEDPRQRAFNIYDVRDDMAKKNMVDDPFEHAILTVNKLKNDFGLLSPTIQFLSIDDDGQQPKLIIAGLFGTDPGEGKRSVTINDQELDNIEWSPTGIYCDIPESGSNASGTVVVKVGSGAGARESNPVNITEWNGELTYERTEPGSQTAEMKVKLRIFADIHPFRDFPGEQPFETTVLFNPRAGDVGVHMTTGGVYERTIASCKDTFTLGDGGDIGDPMGGGQGTDGSWTYFGSVDTQSHTLQLSIAVLGVFKAGQWVRTRIGPDDCDPFTNPIYATMVIDKCLYDDLVGTQAFRMQMGDDFTVPADDRGPCDVDPLTTELIGDGLKAQAKIKWSEMTPFFVPDPDAAR